MRKTWWWMLLGLLLALIGAALLARLELNRQREAFDTDARIAHRLLSQRVVQHDAILATLALLQPGAAEAPEQRLPALYAQILKVQRRDPDVAWSDAALSAAEARSRELKRPTLVDADLKSGRYRLLLAAEPSSFALTLDLRALVPWSDWPMAPERSPVRVSLAHQGMAFVLQPGDAQALTERHGWRLEARKHLASPSQDFEVVSERQVGWGELPWAWMLAWCAAVAAVLAVAQQWLAQRRARERAEALLRLGQLARLNTLGELAAGLAHELNQPLTAVLANAQAAVRLLADDPPEPDTARLAMQQAADQARRAAEVLGRLRRSIERPDQVRPSEAVDLAQAAWRALDLLEPECQRRQVLPSLSGACAPAQADPVALDQILHNLLMNALQALEQVPAAERRLEIRLSEDSGQARLCVSDSGPGFSAEQADRLFEPFYSTREGGLGLGLPLCETLASHMGGSLAAAPRAPRGAVFTLRLPLVRTA
jgi:C4-dicarboxylate-specific signal transduction histidine kinase